MRDKIMRTAVRRSGHCRDSPVTRIEPLRVRMVGSYLRFDRQETALLVQRMIRNLPEK